MVPKLLNFEPPPPIAHYVGKKEGHPPADEGPNSGGYLWPLDGHKLAPILGWF